MERLHVGRYGRHGRRNKRYYEQIDRLCRQLNSRRYTRVSIHFHVRMRNGENSTAVLKDDTMFRCRSFCKANRLRIPSQFRILFYSHLHTRVLSIYYQKLVLTLYLSYQILQIRYVLRTSVDSNITADRYRHQAVRIKVGIRRIIKRNRRVCLAFPPLGHLQPEHAHATPLLPRFIIYTRHTCLYAYRNRKHGVTDCEITFNRSRARRLPTKNFTPTKRGYVFIIRFTSLLTVSRLAGRPAGQPYLQSCGQINIYSQFYNGKERNRR